MRKNVSLLILVFLFIQFNLIAQENNASKIKLKAFYNFNSINYSQSFNLSSNDYLWMQSNVSSNSLGEFSIGATIEKSPTRSHEFEIMPLSIQSSSIDEIRNSIDQDHHRIFGQEINTIKSRFRYQYNFIYPKQKVDFYLGLSSMLTYFYQGYKPLTSLNYHRSYSQIGLVLGITPGIEIPINDKLFWSVDIPIGIAGVNLQRLNSQNPSIKQEERTQSVLNGEVWHQDFQVRFGLGFNL